MWRLYLHGGIALPRSPLLLSRPDDLLLSVACNFPGTVPIITTAPGRRWIAFNALDRRIKRHAHSLCTVWLTVLSRGHERKAAIHGYWRLGPGREQQRVRRDKALLGASQDSAILLQQTLHPVDVALLSREGSLRRRRSGWR